MDIRDTIPFAGMAILMLLVQAGALLISPSMTNAGYAAFEDPSSAANPLIFIAILLVFTAFILLLLKFGKKSIITGVIALSIFLTFIYIWSAIASEILGFSDAAWILAILLSVLSVVLLYKYPEWYVIDVLGVLICAGAASIFGISLEILPVILLLLLLAVYDAISVYRTKHMVTLAEGVLDSKAPILVIVPKSRDYSYINEGIELSKGKDERGAFMMGMGDLIMPTILVVSSHVFGKAEAAFLGLSAPTIGAMAGTFAGLAVLLWFVNSGRPQAGLPTLNGGAILGFILVSAATASWAWI